MIRRDSPGLPLEPLSGPQDNDPQSVVFKNFDTSDWHNHLGRRTDAARAGGIIMKVPTMTLQLSNSFTASTLRKYIFFSKSAS